ncbi:hypothetical protein [uncultured Clostridium sp.]|uniref:hypothetical protein n=1 Tax=uncultured Clostridium sp. TaxID=59620 RepID=UPI0025D96CF7|nr:hypothetical protein [uncultured Clostridium sp.]MDU4884974.1 hypothetical protein [Clostridium celatum]MDU7078159.1 hypothetical protein [Clostridium celatum]
MGKHLDILHKLVLDKEINRRERDMLIALKSFDFEDSNVISIGLKSLLDYFCIKNKECIYSILRKLQAKNYIRIEKKCGKKNVYVIIKDYLSGKDVEDNGYNHVSSNAQSGYTDVSIREKGRYADVPSNVQGRYTDETSGTSGHADVSSCEKDRYKDIPSTGYADVTGNGEGGYTEVSSHEESRYIDETSDVSRHADVSSCDEGRYKDVPSTRYADVSSDDQGGYDNVSTPRNNIYINNNNNKIFINNKIYINIINHWNSKKIGKSVSLNIKVIDSINKAMSKYSFAEIKKAIDNYAKVYISDYFYDFQWHLSYFLTRNNAIGKFVDDGEIWLRYKKKYYTLRDEYEEWGINTEDYINSI